jgi:digeranylgeranylglycerophospholipid reductase
MRVGIIGAGISGLYLGWKLSEKGHEVTIFEKREKIGKEVCSGLFSERILEFIPQSKNLIQNEIEYCLIHFPKKRVILRFLKKFFIINHSNLDNLVADLAKTSGAKIILNSKIDSIPENFERIIGCDGANSKMREILGLKKPNFYLGIQGFLKKRDYSNLVETWVTKNGFLWKIPRGEEIEYGIFEKPSLANKIFETFLKNKKIKIENKKAALIAQGFSLPKNENITLCGEALGLTKPWSGGGVIWGLVAANFLLESFPDFKKYQEKVSMFFKREIAISKFLKKIVYFFGSLAPYFLPKKAKIDGDFFLKKKLDL